MKRAEIIIIGAGLMGLPSALRRLRAGVKVLRFILPAKRPVSEPVRHCVWAAALNSR